MYLTYNQFNQKHVVVDQDGFPFGQGDTRQVALQSARDKLGDFDYDDLVA